VWDKASRLDLVFGSTCSSSNLTTSIEEVMDAIDSRVQQAVRYAVDDAADDDDSCSESDDDEEGGIAISIRPTGTNLQKLLDADRSTHFLAIRVSNPEVVERLVAVQDAIVAAEPVLREACMKPGLFHITLAMLRLDGIVGIQAAVDAVESFPTAVWPSLLDGGKENAARSPIMDIRRLNNFGHRVVYAEVQPRDPSLFESLVRELRQRLEAAGGGGENGTIKFTNSFDFVPHLTLAKVSRPMTRMRRSKFIDEAYYAAHTATEFGQQVIDNLQLCIIEAATRHDGFYTTLAQVQL
jgi:2'-5' RNA ligase